MKRSIILNSLNDNFDASLKIEELEKRLEMLILKPLSDLGEHANCDIEGCDDKCGTYCDGDRGCDGLL